MLFDFSACAANEIICARYTDDMNSPVIPIVPILDQRTLPIPTRRADGDMSSVPNTSLTPFTDTRGRIMRDLRISVTDRCNFRCTYCMPKEVFDNQYQYLPQSEVLTFEEITSVARVAVGLGVTKLRLTGGEPLMRKGIEDLIAMLAELRSILPALDITLTTNGSALKAKAKALKDAGLSRLTVSLDSLDDATFRAMNDVDFPVAKVLEAIDAASAAGFTRTKINMVVKRGVNDHHIVEMARYFKANKNAGNIVRFIEFMDVGSTNGWRMDDVIPSHEVVRRINESFPCAPANPNHVGEVAKRWIYADGSGEFGVISSVTEAFCNTCTRARLSTDGALYTCLFAQKGYDLKRLIRRGVSGSEIDNSLRDAMMEIWQQRRDNYSEVRTAETAKERKVEMSFIGG
jgi:GTP 3',8-cyclase